MPRTVTAAYTTLEFFLRTSLPKSGHPAQNTCSLTKPGEIYKSMFHTFKVRDWPNFNKNASKVLAGANAKQITGDIAARVETERRVLQRRPPNGETQLATRFCTIVLDTANWILEEIGETDASWCSGSFIRTADGLRNLNPDVALERSGAGSSSQSCNTPLVVGEVKLPCYSLRSRFIAKELTDRIRDSNYLRYTGLDPFYQALSYAIHSETGVGLLTNFDENRFLKVNIRSKEIWVSDLVNIDQRLDPRTNTPHAIQALLYARNEALDKKEFSTTLVKALFAKAGESSKAEKKKEEEDKKKKQSSSRGDDGAGSSKDHARSGKSKNRSSSLFPPVSCVLQQCKMIGMLGEGVTGEVNEFDYNGLRVAVKVGVKDYSSELDCVEHVRNEIGIYETLKDLQGSVIPRVIEAGMDTVYNASFVLITEKVGMAVEATEREIRVGGKVLDRENLILFKQKGLEGLRKVRARGVVHDDPGPRNLRVEVKDGKVERVCLLDFGRAWVVDDEGRRREGMESEDDGEVEAKSEESEESEDVEYLEERMETEHARLFERFVDEVISYTEE